MGKKAILSAGRRKIRVKFVDYWCEDHPQDDNLYKILSKRYDLELSDNPDYVFGQRFGYKHLYYENAIKIEKSGENTVPDFNFYDYAIGCDFLEFGDRYLRVPMVAFNPAYAKVCQATPPCPEVLLNRDFCSFVVSNGNGHPLRLKFFQELSKYKKVSSGGRFMNNIGQPGGVRDKLDFISHFKFNICFENSASPGYTTEKIIQALAEFTVPIYWGNPLVEKDFNSSCFILLRDEEDVERVIEEIIHLDKNDDEYLKRCTAERFSFDYQKHYDQAILDFLSRIIDQPLEQARRLMRQGFQPLLRKRELEHDITYNKAARLYDFISRIRHPFDKH